MRPDVVGSGQSDQKIIGDDGEIMLTKFRTVFVAVFLLLPVASFGQTEGCGDPSRRDGGGYGPYDYTNPTHFRDKLPIVNDYHFNARVENLVGGNKEESSHPGGDLNYVLMAFPNHHRALAAMMRLSWKENRLKPIGSHFSVECWLDRAVRWRPEDGVARMLYGNYLANDRIKRYKEAIPHYDLAEQRLKNNSNLFYNIGLLHFHMKDYDKSREYAKKAYARGFPLPGLRQMLVRVGKWEG